MESRNEDAVNFTRAQGRLPATPVLQSLMTTSYTNLPQQFIPVIIFRGRFLIYLPNKADSNSRISQFTWLLKIS